MQGRGIFMHPTWVQGTMYFDQHGCCDDSKQRVSVPVPWNGYNVYTVRRTPSFGNAAVLKTRGGCPFPASQLNKMAIFVNGSKQIEGSAAADNTTLNGLPCELGGGFDNGYDWQADLGAFAVFGRALADSEVKLVADWLKAPMYGSQTDVDGDIDPAATSGVCVSKKAESGQVFDSTLCYATKPNADGTFNTAAGNGSGWCYTSPSDEKARGHCRKSRQIDMEAKYDRSKSLNYVQAREFCETKGGRLCQADEICDAGRLGRPHLGYKTLSPDECAAAGGSYNSPGGFCGTLDSGGLTPYNIPNGEQYLAIEDGDNAWMYVGDDKDKMCRSHADIYGAPPSWGATSDNPDNKRNVVCCGLQSMTECEHIADKLKNFEDDIKRTSDPATLKTLQAARDALKSQWYQKCVTEPYNTAIQDLKTAQDNYNAMLARIKNTRSDKTELLTQLYQIRSVKDSKGKLFLDDADAKANGGVPGPDGTFQPFGVIITLQQQIAAAQAKIKAELERMKACPTDPTCAPPPKPALGAPTDDSKCTFASLKSSILASPGLAPEKLSVLQKLFDESNLLATTDIRQHPKFYDLVKRGNVHPCAELPPPRKQTVADFKLDEYPGFLDQYVPLASIPLERVAPDKRALAARLQGRPSN